MFGQTDGRYLFKAVKDGNDENFKMVLQKGRTNINIQDDKMQTPLHHAASLGKLEIVQLLLDYNANCNAQDSFGNTPLHLALRNDHLDCFMKILECDNLDVNLANEAKDTPLHLAARKGNMEKTGKSNKEKAGKGKKEKVGNIYMEIVDKLLDMKADYNAVDGSGKTLLHIIAADGHVNCCEKVLQWDNVNINARDDNENTPLHLAAKAGKSDIVALLHNYHAQCNLQNSFGDTPLHLAVTGGHSDCFKELMKYDNMEIDLKNNNMSTPLHCAAKTGNSEIVGRLLDISADCNAQDISGDTPLHKTARIGDKTGCDLILKYPGVDVNMKNKMLMTALHLAAQHNNHEVTQLLLDKGANWKLRDKHDKIPLHYAATNGCERSCEHLMKALKKVKNLESLKLNLKDKKTPLMLAAKGGYHRCCEKLLLDNIDAKDNCGNTALFYAIEGNLSRTVSFLLEKNADVSIKYHGDRTVLHLAVKNRADECLLHLLKNPNSRDLLLAKDADSLTPLHEAIKSQALTCAEILLKHGASPTVTCKDGMTPLHLAAEQGDPGISSLLLTCHDIDVNKENDRQETALHVAAMHGHKYVCKTLMGRGTRMLATDKYGRTALHLAALRGHDKVVTFLIKRGLSPLLRDDGGSTALHLAAAKGHLKSCQILVAKAKGLILDKDKENKVAIDIAFENKHDKVFAFLLRKLKPRKENNTNPSHKSQNRNPSPNEEMRNNLHKYMHQSLKPQNYEDPPRVIAAEAIIESEWWQAAFFPEVNNDTERKDQYCTNFHELVNNYPSLALKAQNQCFQCPPKNSGLSHDFRLFEDNLCHEAGKMKPRKQHALTDGQRLLREHPVSLMVQQERSELLQHPLTKAWLIHLWRAYVSYILAFLLFIEVLFLLSLNIFMGFVNNWAEIQYKCNTTHEQFCSPSSLPEGSEAPSNSSEATQNGTVPWMMMPHDRSGSSSSCYESSLWQSLTWYFLLVMTCCILLLEGIYICRLRAEYYFKLSRSLRILRAILTILLLLPIGVCGFQHNVLNTWQWQCGIFGLLLEWILFIHKLNQLPVLFVFMPVTKYFLWNYIKALGYILLFLFAFSYIFHLLLADQAAFESLSQAMMKMIVWLLGDLNYDDTFVDSHLVHPNLARLMFVAFIFIMGGFIANLAIAQPSDRLDEFRKDAAFFQVAAQSTLILEIRACFPYIQKLIINLHQTNMSTENTLVDKLTRKIFKSYIVNEKSTSKDSTLQSLEEQVATLVNLCSEQREELRDMKQQISVLLKKMAVST